jgi:hypothetical protein
MSVRIAVTISYVDTLIEVSGSTVAIETVPVDRFLRTGMYPVIRVLLAGIQVSRRGAGRRRSREDCSIVMHSRATDEGVRPNASENGQLNPMTGSPVVRNEGGRPYLSSVLQEGRKRANICAGLGVIRSPRIIVRYEARPHESGFH